MTLELRPAEMSDLEFVKDCAVSAYELYVERIGKKPAPMVADFKTQIKDNQVEIILFANDSLGYCVSFETANSLFIENIAILPMHQGKGLASKVFEILENRARSAGLQSLTLYTNEKMHENLMFYPKLGFVETQRKEEYGFRRVFFEKQI